MKKIKSFIVMFLFLAVFSLTPKVSVKADMNLESFEQKKDRILSSVEVNAKRLNVNNLTNEEKTYIVNNILESLKDAENVQNEIFNKYTGDQLSSVPTTSSLASDYYIANKPVANNIYGKFLQTYNSHGYGPAEVQRCTTFAELVKSGAPWDLKVPLGASNIYMFIGEGRSGEYIGNHHYGYMGH